MATMTQTIIGPKHHGRKMSLDKFSKAEFVEGWLYELSRGVVDVTDLPGLDHGRIVDRITTMFTLYREAHPNRINYRAGGAECRIRLPGMQSDRRPDQAVYLFPEPEAEDIWRVWTPDIVVEVVSRGGRKRDFVLKREEYLRAGALEYWILDPKTRKLHVFDRFGDTWEEKVFTGKKLYRTRLLPGLDIRADALFGPRAK